MLGSFRKSAEHLRALDRVAGWVRARFALPDDAAVIVAEIACAVPGCPPIETVVGFWTAGGKRHHLKLFKPVAEVAEADLPPAWMKDALAADEMLGCECC